MRVTSLIPVFRHQFPGSSVTPSRSYLNSSMCLHRKYAYKISQHDVNQFQSMLFRTCASPGAQSTPRPESSGSKAVAPTAQSSGAVSVSLGEKVKENAKTGAYGGVILIGIAVTGGLAYVILSELFASDSVQSIYASSFKLCQLNAEVQDALGTPLRCYGEENSRGRRRHVAHDKLVMPDGTKVIRMKYYIEGKFNKGTVHVEKKTNSQGKYEYTYVIVDVEGFTSKRIDVVDTRRLD